MISCHSIRLGVFGRLVEAYEPEPISHLHCGAQSFGRRNTLARIRRLASTTSIWVRYTHPLPCEPGSLAGNRARAVGQIALHIRLGDRGGRVAELDDLVEVVRVRFAGLARSMTGARRGIAVTATLRRAEAYFRGFLRGTRFAYASTRL